MGEEIGDEKMRILVEGDFYVKIFKIINSRLNEREFIRTR
jgi:hypothetical protein